MSNLILNVENEIQKILFENVLKGQISDGMWENAVPHNHWQRITDVKVQVDPGNLGLNFNPIKDNYNFVASTLLEAVGERMIDIANLAENGITDPEIVNAYESVSYKIEAMYLDYNMKCWGMSTTSVTVDLRDTDEEILEKVRKDYYIRSYKLLLEKVGSHSEILSKLNGTMDMKKLKKELRSLKKIMKMRF